MNLQVIDNHSVAVDLLTKGPVLDAGCRGFGFARWFAERGHEVEAFDPLVPQDAWEHCDWELESWYQRVKFYQRGIVGYRHASVRHYIVRTQDVEATYLTTDRGTSQEDAPVSDIRGLFEKPWDVPVGRWDVAKFNVEGAEYDILATWPGDVANQIVVSFHEHTQARRGDAEIERILQHMDQWYVRVRHEFDERYCAGRNAWDTLLVSKRLAC